MNPEIWNVRYAAVDLVWGAEPNRFVAEAFAHREPAGRALDLACGEGRNAIWLAKHGWQVTAIDYADVAVERGRDLARREGSEVEWCCADITSYEPEAGAFSLVLVSYLQVPKADLRRALENARVALAPRGELFMIGHALRNLEAGVGGPQQPSVLWDPGELIETLTDLGLAVDSCAEVLRAVVQGDDVRQAIDVQAIARRVS